MRGKILKFRRVLLGIILLIILFSLVYILISKLMPDLIPLLKSGDEDALEGMLKSEGKVYAILLTMGMEFVQTFSIIIPGMPINIAAGLVFGGLEGTAICTIGFVAANVVVFILARRLSGLVDRVIPENGENSSRLRFLSETKNPVLVIILAYGVPGVPNGFIPYISAKQQITVKEFAVAVLCGSLPGIAFSNFIGHFLLKGNYEAILLLAGLWLGLFAICVISRNKLLKWVRHFSKVNKNISAK